MKSDDVTLAMVDSPETSQSTGQRDEVDEQPRLRPLRPTMLHRLDNPLLEHSLDLHWSEYRTIRKL
jgi:hypothetical protein